MNRYFQVTTDNENPTAIREITDSAARSCGDKGHKHFTLRTGEDEAGYVGFHATDLTSGQQQRLEAFRLATAGCELPSDWLDYCRSEQAAANREYDSGDYTGVPLKRSGPAAQTAWQGGAGEYTRALSNG